MAGSLKDAVCTAMILGTDSLEDRSGTAEALCNVELRYVHVVVVLCICHSRCEKLLNRFTRSFGCELEDCQCLGCIYTADEVENDLNLAGRDAKKL